MCRCRLMDTLVLLPTTNKFIKQIYRNNAVIISVYN